MAAYLMQTVCAATLLSALGVMAPVTAAPKAPPANIANATAPAAPGGDGGAANDGSAVLRQLHQAIGLARCKHDGHCRSVAVGTMACGGPEGYLAASAVDGQQAAIRRHAAEYAQARQNWHAHTGMLSVCRLVPDPGVRCEREPSASSSVRWPGRCVLNATAGGADPR